MKAKDRKSQEDGHVVFDFTGLDHVDVEDLAMILTARLHSAPGDSVWVRSLPERTAEILRYLRLDHFFLRYPEDEGQPH
jgi:anti-anti-sigma regulatory factor